jgi:phage-related tail protein
MAQEFFLGIKLGVLGAGAVGAAIGQAQGALKGLGDVARRVQSEQDRLGEAIRRHMGRLAPPTIAALNRDYERLGRTIDAIRQKHEALSRAMQRRSDLADARARMGGEIMGAYATAAATGAPVIAAVREAAGFGDAVKDIAIVGELTREEEARLGASLREVARATNQTAADIAGGVGMLIANGLEAKKAAEQAQLLGKFTTATRASLDDAAKMMVSFDLLGVKAQDMELAFAQAAKAGKLGSFEVRDMARWFPQLGGYMKAIGITGNEAVVNMASRLQIAMRTAGSTDEAANNFRNFLAKLTSPDTKKDFEKLGIDLQGSMLTMARQGVDPIEGAVGLIMGKLAKQAPEVTKELGALAQEMAAIKDPAERAAEMERRRTMIEALGQRAGMGQMFQDMQAVAYLLAEIQNRDDLKKIREETATGKGASGKSALDEDFEKRMQSPLEQFKRFKIELQELAITVGEALLPPLLDIVRAVQPAVTAFAAFAKENPALIKGLVGAAMGLVAFKVAALSLGWVVNFFLLSPLASATVAWQALTARVLIGRAAMLAGATPLRALGAAAGMSGGMMAKLGAGLLWFKGVASTALMFVGRAVLWLGRAMLTNPIGLILTAIAAAAYLVWRNWDKIGPLLARVWERVKEGFAAAWAWFKALPGKMLEMGREIVSGLIDGIKARIGALGDAVKGMGESVKNTFKGWLGIKSPSRVFAGFGEMIGEGAAQGIAGMAGAVGRATAGLALAATTAFQPTLAVPQTADATRTIRQAVEPLALPRLPQAPAPVVPTLQATNRATPSVSPAMHITFSPQITVSGAASPEAARAQVGQAVQLSFAEFERLMRRYEHERRRISP